MSADPRLSKLLDAVLSVASDLDLTRVLEHVVEAACTLLDARYGALGVIRDDGAGLASFVHHGMDADTVARIGGLPSGDGVLGVVIEEPRPLRLERLHEHARSVGFPPGHPPMEGFLGAPIRVRDEVFGNLYLAEKRDGTPFDSRDEQLLVGLSAVAGAAIANARLYDEARRRDAWRDAVLEVSAAALSGQTASEVRQRVAELGRHLVDGDGACLVEPYDGGGLWVLAAVGRAPTLGFLDEPTSAAWQTLEEGRPARAVRGPVLGPASLWVPVRQAGRTVAALGVGRSAPFPPRDEQLLAAFGAQVSFAWTYERAQTDLQRLRLVEDRERIGRDLHDTVIQRLFATGLSLQAAIRHSEPDLAERLERATDDIDRTIREIRSTIFALQAPGPGERGVRSQVLEVVEEVAPHLPRAPRVRFDGPIDTVVGEEVHEHLIPILREALTNVAKHAAATDVEVELSVDQGGLHLRVSDDGRGMAARGSGGLGLGNLHDRAAGLGGTLELGSGREGRGTSVVVRIPSR